VTSAFVLGLTFAFAGWAAALAAVLELRRRAGLIADAGHELRAPLGAIALGLETFRRQPVARRRAEALLVELGRAEAAVDDVREAARGRRAAARGERVALGPLVECSGEAWAAAAERAGGKMRFDWPAEPATRSATVRADRRRLAQAFGNLLANAVEHGGGDVVVRGRRVPGAIRVEVVDGGARAGEPGGTSPHPRDRLRSQLGFATNSRTHGRGLAIAERALREAGGRLEAREAAEGGRIAIAELPVHDGA
jgi:signal transduction histidine kinase